MKQITLHIENTFSIFETSGQSTQSSKYVQYKAFLINNIFEWLYMWQLHVCHITPAQEPVCVHHHFYTHLL